jgi:hypothetical protein
MTLTVRYDRTWHSYIVTRVTSTGNPIVGDVYETPQGWVVATDDIDTDDEFFEDYGYFDDPQQLIHARFGDCEYV